MVRTLVQIGRKQEASNALRGDLVNTLHYSVEAYPEILSLVRPFFTQDWSTPAAGLSESDIGALATEAALAFSALGEHMQAAELDQVAIRAHITTKDWRNVRIDVNNLSVHFYGMRVIGNSPARAFADLHLIVSKVLISARRA